MKRLGALMMMVLGVAPVAGAQTDTRLVEALRLAREGMGDSARAVTARILETTPPGSGLYPEALYTAAMVADEAAERSRLLTRVAIEYARSDWADDARLELIRIDYAARDLDGAVRHADRLLSDYPSSPLRAHGALWGSRAALDQRQFALACQWAAEGVRVSQDDIELRNQLEFQVQRCQGMREADSTRAAPVTPTPTPTPPAARSGGPGWYVQAAAFRTRTQADDLVRELQQAELRPLVVEDDGFFKVRVGPYADRAAASAAIPAVRRHSDGQPFVVRVR